MSQHDKYANLKRQTNPSQIAGYKSVISIDAKTS